LANETATHSSDVRVEARAPVRIPLARPYVTEATKERVRRTLESGWITEGPVTRELEEALARFIGCRAVIAVTSCTTGLEAALRALGVGPGDEVIVPDYTYPCTASIVALLGATAVIVDVDRETMLVDYDKMEAAITPRTKALMPVSLFGNPLDYGRLEAIRQRHGLPVIEDAACSVGSRYGDDNVGAFADLSVFSLHPRKTLTTGEGGFITTDDPKHEAWIRAYKNFGLSQRGGGYQFDILGTNYKMSDIVAALGLGMMDDLESMLAKRRAIAARYSSALSGVDGVALPRTTSGGVHSWQSYPVYVDGRDRMISAMREVGIQTQFGTHALHRYEAFRGGSLIRLEGDLSNSDFAYEHCLVLPLYHEMTDAEVDQVIAELKRLL
jgi:dTDP-4-amino-4,6-dideoxygalactose transaminase